jgi:ABC-type phosphate transport system permease subunit
MASFVLLFPSLLKVYLLVYILSRFDLEWGKSLPRHLQKVNHPRIGRNLKKVSPLLVILAIIAGSTLGGLLGVLIAIPTAAALCVFVKQVIAPAIRQQTGAP